MSESKSTLRPRVLVISAAPVGSVMTGPAIRSWEFAEALRPHAEVTLASVEPDSGRDSVGADVVFRQQEPSSLRPHITMADVVIGQPPWPVVGHWLRRSGARLIFDLYDPEPLEMLAEQVAVDAAPSRLGHAKAALWKRLTTDRVLGALSAGNQFICASEKQRDLWIGAIVAERLVDPEVYARDPSFRSVIDVAPFGLPSEPPRHTGSGGIREQFPQIGADEEIVLWNGGIWNWLDAPSVVRAMAQLVERRPQARLVFMGRSAHGQAAAEIAQMEARDLGLLDRVVFFNDTWVSYESRADWLLEADCAVSAHSDNLETRFAFRTRLLDCFWAGLPIVCTEGDELATRVQREGLGLTVPPGSPEAIATALEQVLEQGRASYRDRLARVAEEYTWSSVARPVVRFATATDDPPRLGSHPLSHPARRARTAGFRTARSTLNAVGLDHWPAG